MSVVPGDGHREPRACPRLLILSPFEPQYLRVLGERFHVTYENWIEKGELADPEELGRRLRDEEIEALVVEADFVLEETFAAADCLRFVGVCRNEPYNVDLEAATSRGVLVVNTPGRNAVAVAELTVAQMFNLARFLPAAMTLVNAGQWEGAVDAYSGLQGSELAGRTAGIIGLGAIGRAVARRLVGLEMRVLAFDPYVDSSRAGGVGASLVPLESLLRESDFVTLHCPVTPETAGMLDAGRLALLKPTAFLINTARAALLDEPALVAALREQRFAGAALDVFEVEPLPPSSPLMALDNVLLTPHIGGATRDVVRHQSRQIVEALQAFYAGHIPASAINPEVMAARHG